MPSIETKRARSRLRSSLHDCILDSIRRSGTMIVIRIAITPSLNASRRPLLTSGDLLWARGRSVVRAAHAWEAYHRCLPAYRPTRRFVSARHAAQKDPVFFKLQKLVVSPQRAEGLPNTPHEITKGGHWKTPPHKTPKCLREFHPVNYCKFDAYRPAVLRSGASSPLKRAATCF